MRWDFDPSRESGWLGRGNSAEYRPDGPIRAGIRELLPHFSRCGLCRLFEVYVTADRSQSGDGLKQLRFPLCEALHLGFDIPKFASGLTQSGFESLIHHGVKR